MFTCYVRSKTQGGVLLQGNNQAGGDLMKQNPPEQHAMKCFISLVYHSSLLNTFFSYS